MYNNFHAEGENREVGNADVSHDGLRMRITVREYP
jgi:hypothetical protein